MSKRRRYDAVFGDLGGYYRWQIPPAEHRRQRELAFAKGGGRQGRRRRQRLGKCRHKE